MNDRISQAMGNVNCYLCGSDSYSVLFPSNDDMSMLTPAHIATRDGNITKEYSNNWVRCRVCGLVYANPAPDEKFMAQLYMDSDQGLYGSEVQNIASTYRRYLDKYADHITRRGFAVDVGAGNGFFLSELLDFGFKDVVGFEPSLSAISSAPEHIRPFMRGAMFKADTFEPGSVDFISCFQTLEHVHRPNNVIDGFAKALAPGGIAYVITHDVESWGVKLFGSRHPIVNAAHLSLFGKRTLKHMFESHGFKVVAVFNISNTYSVRYWTSLLPIPARFKKAAVSLFQSIRIISTPITISMGNIGLIAIRI